MRRPNFSVAVLAAGLLATVAFARQPVGEYTLDRANGRSLPLWLGGGVMPGEGAALIGATLRLERDGRFSARIGITWTDSGTVQLPITATGRWRVTRQRVVLEYRRVQHPPWCPMGACADTARVDSAWVTATGLEFVRLAGLGSRALPPQARLHFRRAEGK